MAGGRTIWFDVNEAVGIEARFSVPTALLFALKATARLLLLFKPYFYLVEQLGCRARD
jgi:hypothetical protein